MITVSFETYVMIIVSLFALWCAIGISVLGEIVSRTNYEPDFEDIIQAMCFGPFMLFYWNKKK